MGRAGRILLTEAGRGVATAFLACRRDGRNLLLLGLCLFLIRRVTGPASLLRSWGRVKGATGALCVIVAVATGLAGDTLNCVAAYKRARIPLTVFAFGTRAGFTHDLHHYGLCVGKPTPGPLHLPAGSYGTDMLLLHCCKYFQRHVVR